MTKLKDILLDEGTRCWKGYEKKGMKTMFGKRVPNCVKKEAKLPDEGFSDPDQMRMYEYDIIDEVIYIAGKKVKKMHAPGDDPENWEIEYEDGSKEPYLKHTRESVDQLSELEEDLRKWLKQKWVRIGPDGKIRGSCGGRKKGEGKPKCLPLAKARSMGKKKRASAARRKRREDPNPDRRGKAKNVSTYRKKKTS